MTANLNSPAVPKENGPQYRRTPSPQHTKKLPTLKLRMTLSPTSLKSLTFSPTKTASLLPLATWRRFPIMTSYVSFLLNKKKTGALSAPWSIPDRAEFDQLINEATLRALSEDCLTPYAWADPKRGNIALYAASRLGLECFREVICSISPPDAEFQYETYLHESVVQKYSITIMLRTNLAGIQNDALAPVLFKRNRYLKGSLRIIKIKFFAAEDRNSTGISRAGWRLFHMEVGLIFSAPLNPFLRTTSSPWAPPVL